MADKVYIVTSGCWSDYHIVAAFLNKEKAELYKRCHVLEDPNIEEYVLSDDKIYTPKNSVEIRYKVINGRKTFDFKYHITAHEDDSYFYQNRGWITVWNKNDYEILLKRKLPDEYEEWEIEAKYERVMYDIDAEIKNMMSELYAASFGKREEMLKLVEQAISAKYGLEVE